MDSPTRRHFNPENNPDIDNIKGLIDGLIKLILDKTQEGSPSAKRAAALAVTNLEQGGMWAVKALSIQAEEA